MLLWEDVTVLSMLLPTYAHGALRCSFWNMIIIICSHQSSCIMGTLVGCWLLLVSMHGILIIITHIIINNNKGIRPAGNNRNRASQKLSSLSLLFYPHLISCHTSTLSSRSWLTSPYAVRELKDPSLQWQAQQFEERRGLLALLCYSIPPNLLCGQQRHRPPQPILQNPWQKFFPHPPTTLLYSFLHKAG